MPSRVYLLILKMCSDMRTANGEMTYRVLGERADDAQLARVRPHRHEAGGMLLGIEPLVVLLAEPAEAHQEGEGAVL